IPTALDTTGPGRPGPFTAPGGPPSPAATVAATSSHGPHGPDRPTGIAGATPRPKAKMQQREH
ncbi:MAG: hypothetical protein K2L77_03895, partial [Muribaculaceae bacterium]|nr:hypothetical protein [Muribaculaceae bacterium]